jgi:aryl-alcohol dehydrogenase-like predicted oxidoreductase
MKYRYPGRSGLLVSRISLGTMTFGTADWGCNEKDSYFNKLNYNRHFSAAEFHNEESGLP